jgi:hypothetical protein
MFDIVHHQPARSYSAQAGKLLGMAATAFEFVALSVSSHEPAALATRLTEHSAQGWEVVSIVSTTSTMTAFCKRPVEQAAAEWGGGTAATGAPVASTVVAAPVETPAQTAPVTTAATPAYTPAAQPASTPAVPAGWYTDPSGRYELRYWNGDEWTEHVARNGQQYTDAPVA